MSSSVHARRDGVINRVAFRDPFTWINDEKLVKLPEVEACIDFVATSRISEEVDAFLELENLQCKEYLDL